MVNQGFARYPKAYLLALMAPFIFFAINDIGFCLLSRVVDLTPTLYWKYTQAWPLNAWYISALRSFHIPENTIAYVILANTNNVIISGVVSIVVFITCCAAIILFQRSGMLRDYIIPTKAMVGIGILPLFGLFCLLFVNFTDTYSLFTISIRRPLIFGLLQLNTIILILAYFIPAAFVFIPVKILRDGLKLIGQANDRT